MAKIKKSTDPARSCWHYKFYIRPDFSFTLDAATGSVCFVGRDLLYTRSLWSQSQENILSILTIPVQDLILICRLVEQGIVTGLVTDADVTHGYQWKNTTRIIWWH